MGKIGDNLSSFEAASSSRDLKCLFCSQSLVGFRNQDREDNLINKRKRKGPPRKRINQEDTSGGDGGGVSSKETLFDGMEVMRKTLQLQLESSLPREDVCDNVSVKDVCCNECFTTTEKVVKIQKQIDTLEVSKLELVQLLQTLIVKSEPWRKAQCATNTKAGPWSIFFQFREHVSKSLPKLQRPCLKIERETSPTPTDQSILSEDIFSQSYDDDFLNPDVGIPSEITPQTDMQPVVKLDRTDLALFTDGDTYPKHNATCEDEDIDNVGGFSPPDSPVINFDDAPGSDDWYQPEEPRKKKRIVDHNKEKKLTAVGNECEVKRKRGRPKKVVQPSSSKNTTAGVERLTRGDTFPKNAVNVEDDDSDNVGGISPPHSPVINYDDEPESDDSYQPQEKRKKKRNTPIRRRLTAVGFEVKRKRGRPKTVQPSSAENTTEDSSPKRSRGRPRKEKEMEDGCLQVTEKRKRGRPSKISSVAPGINETNEATDDPSKSVSDGEDLEFQPMDTSANKNRKSRSKAQKRKADTDSSRQKHSNDIKITEDSSKKWKEDPSAFYPVYALNQSEREYMFLFVKFKITPTSFICQHPNCSEEGRYVGHFTEQTAFLMQRLHIRKQHRVGFRNRYKHLSDAEASKHYYCCCHCQLQLESMSELTEHCEEHHEGTPSPLAVCEVCGFATSEEDLIHHIITHKSAVEKEAVKDMGAIKRRQASRPNIFPCDECDKIFESTTLLRVHRVKHVPAVQRRQHICHLCGELYMSEHMLKNHIAEVHFKHKIDRPYQCPYCEKAFAKNKRHTYEEHVRTHTGEKPFQCEQCGKGFGSKAKYKMHMETHVYEPIPCQYCGKLYKTKNNIRVHHKKHHPEFRDLSKKRRKPRLEYYGPVLMHPCEPCGHLFRYKSALVAHMKNKHRMELQKNEDYPTMWTWEDDERRGWRE